jgi:hypothetical protein
MLAAGGFSGVFSSFLSRQIPIHGRLALIC